VRIFLTKGSKLIENAEEFLTEKEIQTLTEQNLQEIFSLEYVASELQLPGFRIDTLAFNKESSAFYVIEYKKDRNLVIDQGVAYLNLMLKIEEIASTLDIKSTTTSKRVAAEILFGLHEWGYS
jgi:hypothetical protein